MPSGWFIRNVSTGRETGQIWLETSSVTTPESPVTFPKSSVTMPKPPVTLFRNTHQLIACLRQGHGTRLPRSRGNDRRGQIPEMVSIHVRPPEIEDRVMPGATGKATSSREQATSPP
jgi:hypothetical protein